MNKVMIKGRLTSTPELKVTPNGVNVCGFCVAVNRRFERDKTDFINCEAWRSTAEFISRYFTKGKEIAVVGELHIDKYEKDGKPHSMAKVIVDEAEFCGSKIDSDEKPAPVQPGKTEPAPNWETVKDDEPLPF